MAAGTAAVLGRSCRSCCAVDERTPAAQGAVDAINSSTRHLLADAGVLDLLLMDFYPRLLPGPGAGRHGHRLHGPAVQPGPGAWAAGLVAPRRRTRSGWLVSWSRCSGRADRGHCSGGAPRVPARHHLAQRHVRAAGLGRIAVVIWRSAVAGRPRRLGAQTAGHRGLDSDPHALHAIVMAWQIVVGGWTLTERRSSWRNCMGPAPPDELTCRRSPTGTGRRAWYVRQHLRPSCSWCSPSCSRWFGAGSSSGPLKPCRNTVRRVTEPLFRATAEKADRSR